MQGTVMCCAFCEGMKGKAPFRSLWEVISQFPNLCWTLQNKAACPSLFTIFVLRLIPKGVYPYLHLLTWILAINNTMIPYFVNCQPAHTSIQWQEYHKAVNLPHMHHPVPSFAWLACNWRDTYHIRSKLLAQGHHYTLSPALPLLLWSADRTRFSPPGDRLIKLASFIVGPPHDLAAHQQQVLMPMHSHVASSKFNTKLLRLGIHPMIIATAMTLYPTGCGNISQHPFGWAGAAVHSIGGTLTALAPQSATQHACTLDLYGLGRIDQTHVQWRTENLLHIKPMTLHA
jgi:hypothetical protein